MKRFLVLISLVMTAAVALFGMGCDEGGGGCDTGGGNTTTPEYTLTISVSGNGRTGPAAGSYTYPEGTSVTVTAAAGDGAVFAGWSGAATGTANPVTILMNAHRTLTAGFAADGSGGGDEFDLPEQCSGICNSATPVYPTILENGGLGNVTMYTTEPSNGGACNYGVTDVNYFAAMSVNVVPGDAMGQWQGGNICGQCAEVTAVTSQGHKRVVVRIMDKCPDGDCGIDLGGAAPAAVMVDGFGRYDGSWRFVSCQGHPEVSDGPATLDVIQGSNPWWSRVHVRNGNAAVTAILWSDTASGAGGALPFATNPENTYEVPQGEILQSGLTSVRITVNYADGSSASTTLTPAQLSTSGASYPLN